MDDHPSDHPAKRPKLSSNTVPENLGTSSLSNLASLRRSITPPPARSGRVSVSASSVPSPHRHSEQKDIDTSSPPQLIPSPIQLTHIRDFSDSLRNNDDTVKLRDILGDPLIRECWQFNYCFDVDFLMSQFDEDVRSLVSVKVVHGSWKKESENRMRIEGSELIAVSSQEACQRYSNVEPIVAYMPEPFGTHHSKMMILLRHDDAAQVVIHTANMLAGDWANMCQAVWRSPLLPATDNRGQKISSAFGTGARFKRDLLAYLKAYGAKKTGPLVKQLEKYDFSAVRAVLIASVPSKQKIDTSSNENGDGKTIWGWPALIAALRNIPMSETASAGSTTTVPHIVTQMSSIATLGQTDKWLKDVFFDALASSKSPTKTRPRYSIIFPTAEEIRRSLNGYGSGGSIHMRVQSTAQKKQLQYLRPYLCHWAGDVSEHSPKRLQDAGRRRAAPHIKTYIRFADQDMSTIDWAIVTSANLSTQAWGAATNAAGEVRICSWEIGVLLWPELLITEPQGRGKQQGQSGVVAMVPCFKKDRPDPSLKIGSAAPAAIVGFRMPYDLPLTSYSAQDEPWCATKSHLEPDWLGQTWMVES
ncbi:tyrosyl-DNA phosphodiesterase I [Aspergillus desertorum]